jgi:hypothetical protein
MLPHGGDPTIRGAAAFRQGSQGLQLEDFEWSQQVLRHPVNPTAKTAATTPSLLRPTMTCYFRRPAPVSAGTGPRRSRGPRPAET